MLVFFVILLAIVITVYGCFTLVKQNKQKQEEFENDLLNRTECKTGETFKIETNNLKPTKTQLSKRTSHSRYVPSPVNDSCFSDSAFLSNNLINDAIILNSLNNYSHPSAIDHEPSNHLPAESYEQSSSHSYNDHSSSYSSSDSSSYDSSSSYDFGSSSCDCGSCGCD